MKPNTLTGKQERLATDNIKLAYHIAHKFHKKTYGLELDDLISACTYALTKASRTFEENKGSKFPNYAVTCMENEIYNLIKKHKKKEIEVQSYILNGDCETDSGVEFEVIESILTYDNYFEENEEQELMETIDMYLSPLTEKEKRYLLLYSYGLPQPKIGKIMGTSQSYASRVIRNSLTKIRNEFGIKPIFRDNGRRMKNTDNLSNSILDNQKVI